MAEIPDGEYLAFDPIFVPDEEGACSDELMAKIDKIDKSVAPLDSKQHVLAFAIDKRRVTCGDYRSCVETGACETTSRCGDDWPADVTFEQASAYCRWRGKKLPSLLQWQAAVRGPDGKTTAECDPGTNCYMTNAAGVRVENFRRHGKAEFTTTRGCARDDETGIRAFVPYVAAPLPLQLYMNVPVFPPSGGYPFKAEFRCVRDSQAAVGR
ncbi:MAG: SUMF1/EgtB/PvdO family nonheme iron enzyme [Kofleriaceae bacterium]